MEFLLAVGATLAGTATLADTLAATLAVALAATMDDDKQ